MKENLSNYKKQYLRKNLSTNQKINIVDYALQSVEGYKGLLTIVFNTFKQDILNFFKYNKTDYCYVHFTFTQGKNIPTMIIDQDKNSYQEMYCIKYHKYLDF